MNNYKQYINALRACAKEHKDDVTPFAHIRVSDMCSDVANLLEGLEQEPCPDAISRDAVYGILMRTYFSDECSYETFKDRLEQIPPVNPQAKTGWIPVSEELPKKNMPCLVSVGKLYLTQIAIYSDLMGTIDHKIFYQGDYGDRNFKNITQYVRAWMPLPKPYEPQESEG